MQRETWKRRTQWNPEKSHLLNAEITSCLYSLGNSWEKQNQHQNPNAGLFTKYRLMLEFSIPCSLWSAEIKKEEVDSVLWAWQPVTVQCIPSVYLRYPCGWVRRLMWGAQIWGALMSLFGAQLCVCLRRLKSIRYLLGVRASLWLWWLRALERPESPTSTSFSPQSGGREAIRLHRTDALRALKHQNMLSNHPRRAQLRVAWKKSLGEGWLSSVGLCHAVMAL